MRKNALIAGLVLPATAAACLALVAPTATAAQHYSPAASLAVAADTTCSYRVFVGNLPSSVASDDLAAEFSRAGTVIDAIVVRDQETGSSRGFGFVTYANADNVQSAIDTFNGTDWAGRNIRVKDASYCDPTGQAAAN